MLLHMRLFSRSLLQVLQCKQAMYRAAAAAAVALLGDCTAMLIVCLLPACCCAAQCICVSPRCRHSNPALEAMAAAAVAGCMADRWIALLCVVAACALLQRGGVICQDLVWQQLDRLCDYSPLCAPMRLAGLCWAHARLQQTVQDLVHRVEGLEQQLPCSMGAAKDGH